MLARMLPPLLGGSPAVWNIAMVFFQAAPQAGYLYAYLGHRWLRPKRQAMVHLLLLHISIYYLDLRPVLGDPAADAGI